MTLYILHNSFNFLFKQKPQLIPGSYIVLNQIQIVCRVYICRHKKTLLMYACALTIRMQILSIMLLLSKESIILLEYNSDLQNTLDLLMPRNHQ